MCRTARRSDEVEHFIKSTDIDSLSFSLAGVFLGSSVYVLFDDLLLFFFFAKLCFRPGATCACTLMHILSPIPEVHINFYFSFKQ